jgi:WD40 repeat protein
VSFSPDGQQIAAALKGGAVQLWHLSGNLLQEFEGYQGEVNSVSFSPDGQRMVTACDRGVASLWSLYDLQGLLTLGCDLLQNYLRYSANAKAPNRQMCGMASVRP